MSIPARISIITFGVADIARSVAFYEAIGWQRCTSSMDEIAWFRTADSYLGLFGLADLIDDVGLDDASRGSFRRTTHSINIESAAAVDAALDEAVAAGGTLLKPGTELPVGDRGFLAGPRRHGL